MTSEEDQRAKRAAAAAYDYDSDPRWSEYWSNVLIPPNLASRSDVVDHYKRKFYQRYVDPSLVVEAMSANSSQPSGSSASTEQSTTAEQTRPRNPGSTQPGPNATPIRFDRQTIQFSVNAWVLIIALLGILPIMPKHLSNKACRLSLLGTICSSLYSLYTLYGKPRAWNLPSIQSWFQTIIVTKDFMHFVYCLVFVPFQVSFKFALLPLICRALEHDAKFLRRNFSQSPLYRRYFEGICLWVEANITTLGILSSNAEIALGFLLILSIFSWQRNIVQTFMYWHLLKLMYHAPATAGYHQSVWTRIGRTVTPCVHQYTPFFNTPLMAIKRWWFN